MLWQLLTFIENIPAALIWSAPIHVNIMHTDVNIHCLLHWLGKPNGTLHVKYETKFSRLIFIPSPGSGYTTSIQFPQQREGCQILTKPTKAPELWSGEMWYMAADATCASKQNMFNSRSLQQTVVSKKHKAAKILVPVRTLSKVHDLDFYLVIS